MLRHRRLRRQVPPCRISNLDEVREYTKMLKETTAAVKAALRQGSTIDQMLNWNGDDGS
jgi:hypothetical protein